MTPKKYPQNLYTPKNIYFSENPKNILKFKILNPKNDPSLRMYENIRVPLLGSCPMTQHYDSDDSQISNPLIPNLTLYELSHFAS